MTSVWWLIIVFDFLLLCCFWCVTHCMSTLKLCKLYLLQLRKMGNTQRVLTTRSRSSLFLVPPTTPIAAVSSSMQATKMIMVAGVMRTSLIAWYGRWMLITHTPITSISNPTIWQKNQPNNQTINLDFYSVLTSKHYCWVHWRTLATVQEGRRRRHFWANRWLSN